MKPKKVVPLFFGKKEKGRGEKDWQQTKRDDDRRYNNKHPACKSCEGCGKGACTIL